MSCADVGVMQCKVPPSPKAELCSQLKTCLPGRGNRDVGFITRVEQCGKLEAYVSAPLNSGVRAIARLSMQGEVDEEPAEASYLVAEYPAGFCLVAELLTPYFSRTDQRDDFEAHWKQQSGRSRLEMQSHGITYIELDQEEAASGESPVDYELCVRTEYEVTAGKFVRVREVRSEGLCQDLVAHAP